MSDTLTDTDFTEANTIEKRAALTKRIFRLVLGDQRLYRFQPELLNPELQSENHLVFCLHGLQTIKICARMIVFGNATLMHLSILMRISLNGGGA